MLLFAITFFFFCLHRQKCRAGAYCTVQTAREETLTRRKMFYVGAHFLKSAIPDHSHAFHLLDHVYRKQMHHGVVNQAIFCVCVRQKKNIYLE